ncbi:MAG: tRNA lysidine(34) synthetase TilS [Gemmatimonadales bacterium]|nr:tRNA lysidine(34) synthetase TilS [Gemmatimonadales bacterium]
MTLAERVVRAVRRLVRRPGPLLVAVSGGADSLALLHLLRRTRRLHGRALVVAHVDHGIHPDSVAVAGRVAAFAATLGLASHRVTLALGAGASETAARRARRAALLALADEAGAAAIVTAHHADDQLETILMRVAAGSGVFGLGGIRARAGRFVRPLLGVRRARLRAYADRHALPVWDDPANANPRHLRSRVRTRALPALAAELPGLLGGLDRLARHARAESRALAAVLDVHAPLEVRRAGGAVSVRAATLLALPADLALALVCVMGRDAGAQLGARHARAVLQFAAAARAGKLLPLPDRLAAEVRAGRLTLGRRSDVPERLALAGAGGCTAGGWRLTWAPVPEATQPERREALRATVPTGGLVVRAWRPGDRILPLGGTGSRPVCRILGEAGISLMHRMAWPVLEREGEVIWVVGLCRSGRALPQGGESLLTIEAERTRAG